MRKELYQSPEISVMEIRCEDNFLASNKFKKNGIEEIDDAEIMGESNNLIWS